MSLPFSLPLFTPLLLSLTLLLSALRVSLSFYLSRILSLALAMSFPVCLSLSHYLPLSLPLSNCLPHSPFHIPPLFLSLCLALPLYNSFSLPLPHCFSLSTSLHPVLALPSFSSLYLSRNALVRVAVSPSHSVSFDTIPCTAYQARSLSPPTFGLSMVYDADHRCRARIRRLQGRYSNNSRSCRGVIYG